MAKAQRLDLGCGMLIEAHRDWNGIYFTAMRRGSARGFRDPVEMRKWLGLPLKTPSRERFDEWLASLDSTPEEPPAAGGMVV